MSDPDSAFELPIHQWNEQIDKAIEEHLAAGRSRDQHLLRAVVVDAAKRIGLGVHRHGTVRTTKPYLPSRGEPGYWVFDARRLVARLRQQATAQE